MQYYAHTSELPDGRPDRNQGNWQLLSSHLREVAAGARTFAGPFGMEREAELSGLLHDLGKYSERFQARLRDPAHIRGINHWAAGAYAARKYPSIAFAIDGHHTGLPSFQNTESGLPLQLTLRQFKSDASRPALTGACPENEQILLQRFASDNLILPILSASSGKALSFSEALRARMLFSALVDADYLDTEAHFDPAAAAARRDPPLREGEALRLLLHALEAKPDEGEVNQLRRRLLSECLAKAASPGGLFTLTAPTGSGKTLSSLAFALQHIAHRNAGLESSGPRRLRRVIVVIPYTTIIEQTAAVYRALFEDHFGPDYLLEHHSAAGPRERQQDQGLDAEEKRLRRARIAAENWSAPIVVTTAVQFFESLFANKSSHCRKLHNVARSVILFGEVQTLPPRLLPSLLSAVRLLCSEPYGSSAVFMTATQPAFQSARKALPFGWDPRPIETDSNALAETLRRVRIELPPREGVQPWPDIAVQLLKHPQSLCVVNTTEDARNLFTLLESAGGSAFHLSSRLCPAHRQQKLSVIRQRLSAGDPCRLVSTQLIEAGVDIDFPIAFRALGPLDSIIQTAGRCNREGRLPQPGRVIVFRPENGATPPGAYRTAAEKTQEFLSRYPDASEKLHLPGFYAAYFSELYSILGPESPAEDPVFVASEQFDFPKAAQECSLIGDQTRSVLVKWEEGENLIEKLRREKHLSRSEWRKVQRFSVNLYESEFHKAKAAGILAPALEDMDQWFWNSQYDDDLGACHAAAEDFLC